MESKSEISTHREAASHQRLFVLAWLAGNLSWEDSVLASLPACWLASLPEYLCLLI